MNRIGVAVIGAGAWGINHVRVVATEPRCRLVAVVDPDAACRERASAFDTDCVHADPDAVLGDPRVDAVVIATPAPTHAVLARRALEANKHVLIEKPVALSLAEAIALRDLAKQTDRVAMIGHLMLFHPAVIRLRQLVTSGQLGTLHGLHSTRVNLGRHRKDPSVLWSFGPHDLSMFDFVCAKFPTSISARGYSMVQPDVLDVAFLTLRYPGGEMAHVHLSWLHPRKERRLTLVGSERMVEFDDVATDKLRIFEKGAERVPDFTQFDQYLTIARGAVHVPQIPMVEPLHAQLSHFLDCIETATPPLTDLESGVRVTSILDAAQKSLDQDGTPIAPRCEEP